MTSSEAIWRPMLGAVLGLLALPLLILLPEVGLPVAYLALRLLATRFSWAARADLRLRRATVCVRAWFGRMPWPARLGLVFLLAVILAALLWEASRLML